MGSDYTWPEPAHVVHLTPLFSPLPLQSLQSDMLLSSGRRVVGSSGRRVIWSSGRLVVWSSGRLV